MGIMSRLKEYTDLVKGKGKPSLKEAIKMYLAQKKAQKFKKYLSNPITRYIVESAAYRAKRKAALKHPVLAIFGLSGAGKAAQQAKLRALKALMAAEYAGKGALAGAGAYALAKLYKKLQEE